MNGSLYIGYDIVDSFINEAKQRFPHSEWVCSEKILKETDYIFDLDSDKYLGLWNFSQKVAKAMDKVIVCKRIGVAVIGLEVPHAHIHLVPINGISDINFEREKKSFSTDKMQEIADKINFALS